MARIPGTAIGDMISGSQVTMHGLRMFRQMVKLCLMGVLLLSLGFAGWSLWRAHERNPQQVKAAGMYLAAHHLAFFIDDERSFGFTRADGRAGTVTARRVRSLPAFRTSWLALRATLVRDAVRGAMISGGLMVLSLGWFAFRGNRLRRSRSLRGASLAAPERLDRLTGGTYGRFRHRRMPRYRLAGVTWPRGGEKRHTMIVGSTGTGKTVAIREVLAQIRANGDKVIVYDKMGSFIPYFYDRARDFILNPLDARSHDWDMFGEVRHEREWDTIAKAIIPAFKDTADPFWTTAARQLFAAGSAALWKTGEGSIRVIVDQMLRTTHKEIAQRMEGTVSQALLDERNDKMTTSIRAILSTSMKPLTYMPETSRPFSIRNWLQDGREDSALFLSSGGWDHETRMALIATQMEVAIVSMISGGRDPDRNIWFIIDELPTMEQIPSLKSALAESRQFGGCFVIGTQVVSELREIYGRNTAETISGNCNTRLVLGTPDMATAQFCADSLGRSQTVHMSRSLSFGASEVRDGVAISERENIGNVVLPSEVMELPQLHGFLRMGGGFPVARIELETRDWPKIAAHYVPAEVPDPMTGEIYDTNRPSEPTVIMPGEGDAQDTGASTDNINEATGPTDRTTPHLLTGPEEPADAHQPVVPAAAGENDYGEGSDPTPWKGQSPSGPPGYLTNIPPEIPQPTSKKAKGGGKKSGKKEKPATIPMGQPNSGLHADNPEHQAALDFQAPNRTETSPIGTEASQEQLTDQSDKVEANDGWLQDDVSYDDTDPVEEDRKTEPTEPAMVRSAGDRTDTSRTNGSNLKEF